jgi:hypothetical protein
MKKLSCGALILGLVLPACNRSAVEALEQDNADLQERLDYKDKALGSCLDEAYELEGKLRDQEQDSKTKLTQVCDNFESVAKSSLTPVGVTMTEGDPMVISQCSDNLALTVRKITSEGAYLKYMVGQEIRYSDELIWKGQKGDRNSLLVDEGLDHPVLVYVPSCHDDKCDVECLTLRTSHLTCQNPDITP